MARKPLIWLTEEERRQLLELAGNRKLDSGNARRAWILILAHDGAAAAEIARKAGVSVSTVRRLCKKCLEEGPAAVVTGLTPAATKVDSAAAAKQSAEEAIGLVAGTCLTGEVPPGAECRLCSPDWPMDSQVLWTVVPTGGPTVAPALTWQVSVGPSRPGYISYWITVKNLTSVAIPFEGRPWSWLRTRPAPG